MLVDKGVLYKRRGIGMFVAAGAATCCSPSAAQRSPTATSTRSSPRPARSGSAPTTSSRSSVSARPHHPPPPKDTEGRSRMTAVIEVQNLTKRYRDTVAVDDVSFTIEKDTIYGLLGRNGAGKTTVMSILTAQNFATSGRVRVFGEHPYENARVLQRMCFVRESQKYPDDAQPRHAFASARLFFPNWRPGPRRRARSSEFQLPMQHDGSRSSRAASSRRSASSSASPPAPRSPSSTSPTSDSTPSRGRSSTTVCSRTTRSIRAPSSSRRT